MLLPSVYKLYINEEKLSRYLLNPSHPDGSSKAKFFLGHGYKDAHRLRQSLLLLVQQFSTTKFLPTPFGIKYIVDGILLTPLDTEIKVRTVWIVLSGSDICTFVTAYPL